MSDAGMHQMEVFTKLDELMTPDIVQLLQNAIELPDRISEQTGYNSVLFLNALRNWKQFNPHKFDRALQSIGNQTLLVTARELKWLSDPQFKHPATSDQPRSTKSLVELLTSEMTSRDWVILAASIPEVSVKGDEEADEMLKICVDNNVITNDLKFICKSLEIVKRTDLAVKVRSYASTFKNMSSDVFREEIRTVLGDKNVDSGDWEVKLKKYIKIHNKDVSVVLDEKTVPIETVFTALTVIKVKPAEERIGEESGINEIDFLRNIHEEVAHKSVEVVDFDAIITTCKSTENNVWCLIGNPGSGKSFLCKHFAYLYGTNSLPNFLYTVSIPCRSQEWHQLEEARHEGNKAVDSDFIVSWLSLSMSTGTKWSECLSEHLVKSDGEGLFIIMDGADEFTRKVPFEFTLLCKVLERRFLTQSTILVTSRPAAWSELQFDYGAQFHIAHNFQVLGFSPENRDIYFQKRMNSFGKLNAVYELFDLHDEIKQLSLVPVNASLFSALFNESDSILTQTLSHLYTQLIVYIIRRQLSRMGLKEHSKVLKLSDFHPGIRECIDAIGLEANQGIFERELTSDRHISLKIGAKSYRSERLGLMQAHMKVLSLGIRVKVWTFQHLTIQEFMAALSICNNTWTNQCFIVRYITSSTQYMAMYKMVVRFVSGTLRHNAGCITPILCRHALPNPLPLHEAPMLYQLYYNAELVLVSDWVEFTQAYLLLCTVVSEINSDSIPEHFAYFRKEFPNPLFLYFHSTPSPNEWHCFLQSLRYVHEFQIIHFQSDFVTLTQFRSLLAQLPSFKLHYLALAFGNKNFAKIHSYTSLLNSATLPPNTKISIHLYECALTTSIPSQSLFASSNQFTGSLCLYESRMDQQILQDLTNQFASLQNLFYSPKSDKSDWSSIQPLLTNPLLNGLYIIDLKGFLPIKPNFLSGLSSLTELYWITKQDCYNALPNLRKLSNLTYLNLFSSTDPPPDEFRQYILSRRISNNSNSLREVALSRLHRVGFHSWSSFFNVVTSCSNLMVLQLVITEFSSDDIRSWYKAALALKSLIHLFLLRIPLQDTGMLVLCHSLSHHSAIRRLSVGSCKLSSASCRPLMCLIQTLPRMRLLHLSKSELSSPDPGQLQLLTQTAEQCSVKIELRN